MRSHPGASFPKPKRGAGRAAPPQGAIGWRRVRWDASGCSREGPRSGLSLCIFRGSRAERPALAGSMVAPRHRESIDASGAGVRIIADARNSAAVAACS
jgi:hypothetical protein